MIDAEMIQFRYVKMRYELPIRMFGPCEAKTLIPFATPPGVVSAVGGVPLT